MHCRHADYYSICARTHVSTYLLCIFFFFLLDPLTNIHSIPNLPFFYLVYRAWSHGRAISGGKHLQWLLENKLLRLAPSEKLDRLYALHAPPAEEPDNKERTLLTQKEVQTFSDTLDMPALEVELERAIWQVEQAVQDPDSQSPPKESSPGTAAEKPGSTETVDKKDQ